MRHLVTAEGLSEGKTPYYEHPVEYPVVIGGVMHLSARFVDGITGTSHGPNASYVDGVRRKISENWLKYEIDPSITSAKRVYVTFEIGRNGAPKNVQVSQSSGVPSLDQSATRALQRIDTFGPLPNDYSGSSVGVEFWFDFKK